MATEEYVSEKEITVYGKPATLVKTNSNVIVKQNDKTLFEGKAGAFHSWYTGKAAPKKRKTNK